MTAEQSGEPSETRLKSLWSSSINFGARIECLILKWAYARKSPIVSLVKDVKAPAREKKDGRISIRGGGLARKGDQQKPL